jgi:hypothetical protein
MPSKQELELKVNQLSEVVVDVHNTIVTLLQYMEDNIEIEEEDEEEVLEIEIDEDEDEEEDTCCDCGKRAY